MILSIPLFCAMIKGDRHYYRRQKAAKGSQKDRPPNTCGFLAFEENDNE